MTTATMTMAEFLTDATQQLDFHFAQYDDAKALDTPLYVPMQVNGCGVYFRYDWLDKLCQMLRHMFFKRCCGWNVEFEVSPEGNYTGVCKLVPTAL